MERKISVKIDVKNHSVAIIKDRSNVMIYSPAFRLYGYSDTKENAFKELKKAMDNFFSFHTKNNNLFDKLILLGWVRGDSRLMPPTDFAVPTHLLKKEASIEKMRIPRQYVVA